MRRWSTRWPRRRGPDAATRSETKRVHDAHAGDYDGAMAVVRQGLAELDAARADRGGRVLAGDTVVAGDTAVAAVLRAAHERIDEALARAAAAATAVYNGLFEAAGGMYHAESNPDVALWKRHMNTALTLRSQHQMSQLDDDAAILGRPLTHANAPNRAAFGPHQAGVDFDVHLDAAL